jgi:hypothetical protein
MEVLSWFFLLVRMSPLYSCPYYFVYGVEFWPISFIFLHGDVLLPLDVLYTFLCLVSALEPLTWASVFPLCNAFLLQCLFLRKCCSENRPTYFLSVCGLLCLASAFAAPYISCCFNYCATFFSCSVFLFFIWCRENHPTCFPSLWWHRKEIAHY